MPTNVNITLKTCSLTINLLLIVRYASRCHRTANSEAAAAAAGVLCYTSAVSLPNYASFPARRPGTQEGSVPVRRGPTTGTDRPVGIGSQAPRLGR